MSAKTYTSPTAQAVIAEIRSFIGSGQHTASEIATHIRLSVSTIKGYIYHMMSNGLIFEVAQPSKREFGADQAKRWTLLQDMEAVDPDDEVDPAMFMDQRIVPARQIGIERDWSVAALFGAPAVMHGVAA